MRAPRPVPQALTPVHLSSDQDAYQPLVRSCVTMAALREVILAQSGWWHFKWLTRRIAAQIPAELDSLANAQRTTVPAVFVTAQQDCIVPPAIQRQIIDAYGGPLKVLAMPDAGHATPLADIDLERLHPMANWLYNQVSAVND